MAMKRKAAKAGIIRCGKKQCRSQKNVKNVARKMQRHKDQVDLQTCRPFHSNCTTIRFCSSSCLKQCAKKTRAGRRGPRSSLNKQQLEAILQQGIKDDKPWLTVIIFCQVLCGERADCARRLQIGWLQDLSPDNPAPPRIEIPRVNGKTTARTIWLAREHAQQLHEWLFKQPLRSKSQQWPHADLDLHDNNTHLFPGWEQVRGHPQRLDSSRAISERSYLKALGAAGSKLAADRHKAGMGHVFEEFDFKRLGTHSFKRTAVSLLKDTCISTSIVSAVTGTSTKTLDHYYDDPTAARQRKATGNAFSSLFPKDKSGEGRLDVTMRTGIVEGLVRFCACCGQPRKEATWRYCPSCGQEYETQLGSLRERKEQGAGEKKGKGWGEARKKGKSEEGKV